jgi:hypothetical protein
VHATLVYSPCICDHARAITFYPRYRDFARQLTTLDYARDLANCDSLARAESSLVDAPSMRTFLGAFSSCFQSVLPYLISFFSHDLFSSRHPEASSYVFDNRITDNRMKTGDRARLTRVIINGKKNL